MDAEHDNYCLRWKKYCVGTGLTEKWKVREAHCTKWWNTLDDTDLVTCLNGFYRDSVSVTLVMKLELRGQTLKYSDCCAYKEIAW